MKQAIADTDWWWQVLTVLPRYIICNQSAEALDFAQVGSKSAWRLPPGGVRQPWHWADVEVTASLILPCCSLQCGWHLFSSLTVHNSH